MLQVESKMLSNNERAAYALGSSLAEEEQPRRIPPGGGRLYTNLPDGSAHLIFRVTEGI